MTTQVNHTIKNSKLHKTLRFFPERDSIINSTDLKNKWEFITIASHGSLIPDKFIKIPKDTYVIFNSTSGIKSISRYGIAYEDLLVNESDKEFYIKMFEEIKNPKSLLKTFQSTTNKAYYPNNYEKKEEEIGRSIQNFSLSDEQKARAIYPPNSETFVMVLYFKNTFTIPPYKGFILGVHKLPINPSIYKLYHPQRTYTIIGEEQMNIHDKRVSEQNDFNTSLLTEVLFTRITLSELFTKLPSIPRGKKRFIFITGCRNIEFPDKNKELVPIFKRLTRKYSVGQHENVEVNSEYNKLGKKSKENLITYSELKRLGKLNIKTLKNK